jgi:hypothetical protein
MPSLGRNTSATTGFNGIAALGGIQERGQVLGVDLPQIPMQDSARNSYALEYDTAQRRVDFLP